MLICNQYKNMTECHIPDIVLVNGNSFFSRYSPLTKLKYADVPLCVNNMQQAFLFDTDLAMSPVLRENVIDMSSAYYDCINLTGSPVCGHNVTNMSGTYAYCRNLTGSPVCGNKVTNMVNTYYKCTNLTGSPAFPEQYAQQDINAYSAYAYVPNIEGDVYLPPNIINIQNCFVDHDSTYEIHLYTEEGTQTYDSCMNMWGSYGMGWIDGGDVFMNSAYGIYLHY